MSPAEAKVGIQSVQRAFEVLEVLAAEGEMSVHGLASRLDLAPSTVHRFLATLRSLGYVDRNERTRMYQASFKLFDLAARVTVSRVGFLDAARPHLMDLTRASGGEAVVVGVLDGLSVVVVERLALVPIPAPVAPWGARLPCTTTALGRAILSALPPKELDDWLERWRRAGGAEDVDELRAELEVCRRRGYAHTPDSVALGRHATAAPIRNYTGEVVASVALRAPIKDLDEASLTALARRVVETADQISWHLGYRGASGHPWRDGS